MLIRVDPSACEPLFEQLASSVRASVATVLRAYRALRDDGLIELRRGRGAVISTTARDYTALRGALLEVVRESGRLGLSAEATTSLLRSALVEEMS